MNVGGAALEGLFSLSCKLTRAREPPLRHCQEGNMHAIPPGLLPWAMEVLLPSECKGAGLQCGSC